MIPSGDTLDLLIEQLVDGSIAPAERRALLLRLEGEPDGWRRCALAFLEDQAMRSALGGRAELPLARVEPPAPVPVPQSVPIPSLVRRSIPASRYLMAAGLIAVAFLLGMRRGIQDQPASNPPEIAPVVTQAPTPKAAPAANPVHAVGWASVEVDGQTIRQAPVLAGDGLDAEWLESQPELVSEYVRAQWERRGYQVAERRRLVSLNLEDGRRMAIPLDGVELQYVGLTPN